MVATMAAMLWAGWVQIAAADPGDRGLRTHDGASLVIDGAGMTRSYTCTPGQRVVVSGSMLKLTLDGDCGIVEVNGASNTITVDGTTSVDFIVAYNTVTWRRNLSGQSVLPITRTGLRNKVSQG